MYVYIYIYITFFKKQRNAYRTDSVMPLDEVEKSIKKIDEDYNKNDDS